MLFIYGKKTGHGMKHREHRGKLGKLKGFRVLRALLSMAYAASLFLIPPSLFFRILH
jgi:hypothetical protein